MLSTVQMPSGIPVGTLAIGKAGAINAALLAAFQFYQSRYKKIQNKLDQYIERILKKKYQKNLFNLRCGQSFYLMLVNPSLIWR